MPKADRVICLGINQRKAAASSINKHAVNFDGIGDSNRSSSCEIIANCHPRELHSKLEEHLRTNPQQQPSVGDRSRSGSYESRQRSFSNNIEGVTIRGRSISSSSTGVNQDDSALSFDPIKLTQRLLGATNSSPSEADGPYGIEDAQHSPRMVEHGIAVTCPHRAGPSVD